MNILSLIQSQFSPQTVGQISDAVGESPDATKSALGTTIPALLASLIGKASASPGGAAELLNMVKQGGWADSITNVLGSSGGGAVPAANQSLLSSIFGSKLGPVADFIGSHCGIRGGSATSLLGMAAPLLMGTISKLVSSQGLNASGLGQLLTSQIPHLKGALPSGLANILGVGNLLSGPSDTKRLDTASEPAYARAQPPYRAPEPVGASRGLGMLKWAWVPLLLALGVWFVANRHRADSEKGAAIDTSAVTTGHEAWTPAPSSLGVTPGSPADNLLKAISSGDWNKTFDLKGLDFDNLGGLTSSAKSTLTEIGSVLNASPDVKVQITAFGETGEAGQSKANTIKTALKAVGVADERISTHGQTGTGLPSVKLTK
jgi:hypothetical protein